ncbi:DUF6303 family protein [Streptomyces sp. TRM68367]|uniref:DUF6303 family protein n=1 Tax=Streptomyces sp. TRM68367 TaxID=2758415 RepID=UPI00165B06EA|nr:DUF6303 family protein [Streptomyces sp. TRM68367]MBC9726207.1 hypothetical protein [Streptomyces sp. TRM68367]
MTQYARMTNTFLGLWEVYVPLPDTPSGRWPAHDFDRTDPIPTPQERGRALAALGYEIADGGEWQWQESTCRGDVVRLTASVPVRPVVDGGAV